MNTSIEDEFVTAVMKGIGAHLGTENEVCKGLIVGIGECVAKIVSPTGEYSWPSYDRSEIDSICAVVCGQKEVRTEDTPQAEVEDKMEIQPEVKLPSHPSKKWIDMDEEVDIFEEEKNRLVFSIAEEGEETVVSDSFDEDENDFLPYDLSEPSNKGNEMKHYHYIVEPLADLSDQDVYVRLNAWKELSSLCQNENTLITENDAKQVLGMIIEMEEIPGDDHFWEEFHYSVSALLYRQVSIGMSIVFQYVQNNSRSNMTITKCSMISQALINAAVMLTKGTMKLESPEMNTKQPEVFIPSITPEPNENGFIRIANTKYKSSYYKNKQATQKKEENGKQQSKSKSKNQFTKNAGLFLNCVLTWLIRFPPRNELSITYLMNTLTRLLELPILAGTLNDNLSDIAKIFLRYRYHNSSTLRRKCIELFISISKAEHVECMDRNCQEMLSKENALNWARDVYSNDTDATCRLLAKLIIQNCCDSFVYYKQTEKVTFIPFLQSTQIHLKDSNSYK